MNGIIDENGNEVLMEDKAQVIDIVKVTTRIDELLADNIKFKELIILKDALLHYKKEQSDKIEKGTPLICKEFKQILFKNLENALYKFIYIFPKELRNERIKKLYNWYIQNYEKYKSLVHIKERTDRNPNENYPEEEIKFDGIIIRDDKYEMEQIRNHRTAPPDGIDSAKLRLKNYKIRTVNPTEKFKKSETVLDDLHFNLERFHGKVGPNNNYINIKENTRKNYAYTGKPYISNSGIPVDEYLKPINPKREIKSSYIVNRPNYDKLPLLIEKEVISTKHKELALKRNEEELYKQLDEFGKSKARYKEQQEVKFNRRNIVSACQKEFKINKDIGDVTISEEDYNIDDMVEERDEDALSMFDEIEQKIKVKKQVQDNEDNDNEDNDKDNYEDITRVVKVIKRDMSPNTKTNILNKVVYTRIVDPKKNDDTKNNLYTLSEEKTNFIVTINPTNTLAKKKIFEIEKKEPIKPDKIINNFFSQTADNPILKSRLMSAKICSVQEVHSSKEGYIGHFAPLSLYDTVNYNTYQPMIPLAPIKKFRPQSASEFAKQHFEEFEDNYLGLRKKLNEFKKDEVELISENLFKGENSNQRVENYKKALLSPETTYGTSLKRPFSSYLPRPLDKKKKGKKKKKKKR